MKIEQSLKNAAKEIVSNYSILFTELEKLELMASHLQTQKDLLLNKLEEVRAQEKILIDKIGETGKKINLEEILL